MSNKKPGVPLIRIEQFELNEKESGKPDYLLVLQQAPRHD